MTLEFFGQSFKKILKFHESLLSGSQVVPCRQVVGWTDMKVIVAFCDEGNM